MAVPNTYAFDLDFAGPSAPTAMESATPPGPDQVETAPPAPIRPMAGPPEPVSGTFERLVALGTAGFAAGGVIALLISGVLLAAAAHHFWQPAPMITEVAPVTPTLEQVVSQTPHDVEIEPDPYDLGEDDETDLGTPVPAPTKARGESEPASVWGALPEDATSEPVPTAQEGKKKRKRKGSEP